MQPIKDFPGYAITELGTIFNKNGHKVRAHDNKRGYLKVNLYRDGKSHSKYVHRLVAETYLPNPDNLRDVDHINRDRYNNTSTNLRWASQVDNIKNTAGKPRYSVDRKGATKHSYLIVMEVQELYNRGSTVMEISRQLKIPRQTVTRFVKRIA